VGKASWLRAGVKVEVVHGGAFWGKTLGEERVGDDRPAMGKEWREGWNLKLCCERMRGREEMRGNPGEAGRMQWYCEWCEALAIRGHLGLDHWQECMGRSTVLVSGIAVGCVRQVLFMHICTRCLILQRAFPTSH
jgi:hypothetical protein